MKKILFFTLAVGLSFALFTFGQEENKTDVPTLKYKPQKIEIKLPSFPERKLGKEFKDLDDFVREKIAEHPSAEFFMLLHNKKAVGQGRVESFDSEKLVLNSNGFKTTWTISTDTTFLGSENLRKLAQATSAPVSTTSLKVGQRVKVLGEWDGQNLLAKRIISLEPVRSKQVPLKEVQLNKLIEKLQEALQRAGVQIDLKQFLRNKQVCLQVITSAKNPQTGECKDFPTPCDVPQGWEKVNKCE